MEALKSENKDLREAQQRTTRAPPAIEAEQKFPTGITVHWYSDRAALSFGIDSRPEPWGTPPTTPGKRTSSTTVSRRPGCVCTENSILVAYMTESPNVSGDDRFALLRPCSPAVQVEEPT
jgi:hypothetical protein